ncbi:MAG TPA: EVE domain-containing protein [Lacunisphaera sp.]|nr:EVE domain-containing protein [Lacunisphaera sp.]
MKSEPETYSWADLVRDGRTDWTGIRNYAARLHLKAMRAGDLALFYHSGEDRSVVGIARVTKAAFPDATADAADGWVAVELAAGKAFPKPVTLAAIKADATLKGMTFVRQGRLSVSPVTKAEFERLRKLGGG